MMILKVQSDDQKLLEQIAEVLLKERMIFSAMFDEPLTMHSLSEDGSIRVSTQYEMKGISKSLMFNDIAQLIKKHFSHNLPLLYSEPIILIGKEHQENIIQSLAKV